MHFYGCERSLPVNRSSRSPGRGGSKSPLRNSPRESGPRKPVSVVVAGPLMEGAARSPSVLAIIRGGFGKRGEHVLACAQGNRDQCGQYGTPSVPTFHHLAPLAHAIKALPSTCFRLSFECIPVGATVSGSNRSMSASLLPANRWSRSPYGNGF